MRCISWTTAVGCYGDVLPDSANRKVCPKDSTELDVYYGFPLAAAKMSFRHGLPIYMMSRTCSSSGCPCWKTEKSFGYRCHHWSETLTRRKRNHKSKSGYRFIGWLTGMVHLRSVSPREAAAQTHGPHNKCDNSVSARIWWNVGSGYREWRI